jgi:hypothetical protein
MSDPVLRFICRILVGAIALAIGIATAITMSAPSFEAWYVLLLPAAFAVFAIILDKIYTMPARIRRARQKAYADKVRAQTDMSK